MIGAVLVHGAKAPYVIRRDQLKLMKKGAVIVDVSIDQGGCFETSRPTTHTDPTYEVDGVTHYCVANMPGAVPITSTYALTNATLPYILHVADAGHRGASRENPGLAKGVNVVGGKVTYEPVAEATGQSTRSCSTRWARGRRRKAAAPALVDQACEQRGSIGRSSPTPPRASSRSSSTTTARRSPVEIVPAERWREWMNATSNRFANRCLPLLMANQAGWVLINPAAFTATWDGGDERGSTEGRATTTPTRRRNAGRAQPLRLRHRERSASGASSETPEGYNLLARGPANAPKDGVVRARGPDRDRLGAGPVHDELEADAPRLGPLRGGGAVLPDRAAAPRRARALPPERRAAWTPTLTRPQRAHAWEATPGCMYMLGKRQMRDAGDEKYTRKWMDDYFRGHGAERRARPRAPDDDPPEVPVGRARRACRQRTASLRLSPPTSIR